MRLHFLGANRQVTGSRYVLEAGGLSIMIDCGLFQERACLERNWATSPIPPDQVDALLLTHAHLDHCGLIPRFVANGFEKNIYATPASIDLARLVLEDAADIQEEDAAYKKKRHKREGRKGPHPERPLYTREDAEASFRLFRNVTLDKPIQLNERVRVRYVDAGHILGACMLEITVDENDEQRVIVFSGDIGPWNRSLMHDPTTFKHADYVIMESTYGDREHGEKDGNEGIRAHLERVINDTVARGGNILIPTFAIDRAQEIMLHLSVLVRSSRIPRLTTFLDSPMAVDATTIYKRFEHLLDDETRAMFDRGEHPFQFPGMHFVRSVSESMAVNSIRGSTIIMAGSGMCTGGRIKHHLRHNLDRSESTVLFIGYQAEGTLGREIIEGNSPVRIHGRHYDVRAQVDRIEGLSAHADRTDLLRWVNAFEAAPQRVFLTHGEERAARSLAEAIVEAHGWEVHVPSYLEVVELS